MLLNIGVGELEAMLQGIHKVETCYSTVTTRLNAS